MRQIFTFPNPVNEVAARVVATGAVTVSAAFLVTRHPIVLALLAYGFVARVAAGPRFSPLGLLATKVVVPRLSVAPKMVAGPPKRFAQGIGAVLSVGALVAYGLGASTVSVIAVAAIMVAASLEAVLGFCLGCQIFALLIRTGAIPERICRDCGDISGRLTAASSAQR